MSASSPTSRSSFARVRFEELEWRIRATRCPTCAELVVARKRDYFPQLQGVLIVMAPLWFPLSLLARLMPVPWRCEVCGRAQSRSDLGAKEGLELAEAIHNTDRLLSAKAAEGRAQRPPPPHFKRIGVYESLAERGWFSEEPIINAGVQYDSLADAASRAAYRGMKPWLVQTCLILAVVATLVARLFNGWLSAGVGFALAAWFAAYTGRHRVARNDRAHRRRPDEGSTRAESRSE
jgi:hypothetical protein